MGSHPINLGVRLLLEIYALLAMGTWGWRQTDHWFKFILAIGLPLIAAVVWGTFAIANDPSRSGNAPIPVSGIVRLAIEFLFFGFAIWSTYNLGYSSLSWCVAIVVIVHYVVSYDRVLWLLKQ